MAESARDMIKRHEGWRNKPYRCPAGHLTIGWGWNMDANPLPQTIKEFLASFGYILPEHGEKLLAIGINEATLDCMRLYPKFETFEEDRKNALIDFLFNVGAETAREFKKTNAAINRGDWATAAAEMKDSDWYHQVGRRAEEIIKLIRGEA